MNFPDITVVITAHDAGEALSTAIGELLSSAEYGAIHLVDSGSTDGSIESIEERFPNVVVSRFPENPGPCVTRNHGWREAKTPLVLFVDDDMRLAEGCVEALLQELMSAEEIAMVGPRIFFDGSSNRVQYEGGTWHFAGLAHMRGQGSSSLPPGEEALDVDVLTSGCLLARRTALEKIGGFDEALFFLMEDVDLSLRARWMGLRLRAVPRARSWNAGGSDGLSLNGRVYPADRVRLHSRNRLLLIRGLYEPRTQWVLAPAILLMDVAWFVFSLSMGRVGPFLRGKRELISGWGAASSKRRALSPHKRLRDRDLLGAPPLTLTSTAAEKPLVRSLSGLLDAMLRLYWRLARPLVP